MKNGKIKIYTPVSHRSVFKASDPVHKLWIRISDVLGSGTGATEQVQGRHVQDRGGQTGQVGHFWF